MSSLATLSNLTPDLQKDTLAAVTRSLLPHPEEAPERSELKVSLELEREVIDEIRQRLKLKPDDNSSFAQAKVFKYISKALSALILEGSDISEIKGRLGERGSLPPREYRIVYPTDFANFERAFGIRRNHVEDALRNPTSVQHLSPEGDPPPAGFFDISFYAQLHAQKPTDPFSLFVQTLRRKDVQEVFAAWRIHHNDIDLPIDYSPLALFRAFIDTFGKDISVAEKPVPRFLLYDTFPGVMFPPRTIDEAKARAKGEYTVQRILAPYDQQKDLTYVTIAYSVGLIKYCEALQSRGLKLQVELVEEGAFGGFNIA